MGNEQLEAQLAALERELGYYQARGESGRASGVRTEIGRVKRALGRAEPAPVETVMEQAPETASASRRSRPKRRSS